MTTETHPIRVLIVDDEALMRAGIRLMIDGASAPDGTGGIEVVGEAADGAEALAAARETDPDVILMDIRMPQMNGIEATRALQDAGSRAHIIMLTAFDTDDFILDSLAGGAVSFLLKDSAPALVLAAVRDAAEGGARLSPAVMTRLVELASRPSPPNATSGSVVSGVSDAPAIGTSVPAEAPTDVTAREWEVGTFVVQGLTNKDVAEMLHISVSTVKTHLSSLSAKLHATNRTQVAMRMGQISARRGS